MIDVTKKLAGFALVSAVVLLGACSSTPEGEGADGAGTMDGSNVSSQVGSDVDEFGNPLKRVFYFDFDKATLNADVRSDLDKHAKRLNNNSISIRLEGHADERGTREYNLALGERRAKAVANYLAIQGVNNSRIQTISYGEEKPVAFGSDEASWAQNRRVELIDIK
ncbi:MAG: peptidoglycan-associated lipoprotein Pal [Gammaproteobacteria bacterium]|nr:MAG: peptidoglycan-associated lipoprotein Pal [Gammaproteobacteria bacterium]